ncbi:hydantoinase/carbamoylase family amidase [Natronorubrum sp. JWXQ-INN-674]|uniref:Hydantoinase/carbamoylase family amidase n=1 Tax=Natronorubrum halalkaliphilum TaxID=2691917 RepID=A0A6B0VNR4_9EURY|nr:Zn-dependent hydrolase [Natronorubrum halalkaliphilum]MXV62616.1 hydantoinase/carbamoylase family amidase [Natronorubrum halalkaliphilum]
MAISIERERFVETMREQAEIGATEGGGLHRLALSDEDKAIRDWFAEQLAALDLSIRIDEFGNMFGRRDGTDPDADPVLVGSHLDSQPYGGIYDGALGVVAPLELLRTLEDEGIETRRPIEIVNWTNEEGSRFQPAMQGSGVWTNELDLETQYERTDEDGNSVREELERIGYLGDVPAEPRDYEAYFELHIEQGPYLELEGVDVGVVTGVVGFYWGATTFTGEADHSGPTPMHDRSDALVAAADVITGIRRIPGSLGDRTVGTVGYLDVDPNSINIIPGEVTFTWGFRDPSDEIVDEAKARALAEIEAAAEREGVEWEVEKRMRSASVDFADRCIDAVQTSADDLGYDSMQLYSGAGHDAAHLSKVTDTSMVFAVSENGKSHSEEEFTSWDDCYAAANTLANAVVRVAGLEE